MSKETNNLLQRRNCTLTIETEFQEKSINTNKEKDQSCIEEILKTINAHLDDMLEKHSRVMVTRFDIRAPQEAKDFTNQQIGRIIENMGRALDRKDYPSGHDPDPRIIAVAEDHGNGTHHHCLAIVNRNAIQNRYGIYELAERYTAKALGIPQKEAKGLIEHCNGHGENGITITRNSPDAKEKIDQVMHQASYLAKKRGKENTPKGQHLYVDTKVPKKK